ncbi:MAG: type II toxin-antitoxin system HicB family antitoxin [Defluviitaleaceae bacterium]|nr:type II toxin-antitoxin system HicB family antitoxin [Defluviitaleaceae bacterium]
MKYAYTAVFSPDENGRYSVGFPDLPGCLTCGDDMPDAIYMAQDALCLWLYDMEQSCAPIPNPQNPRDIKTAEKEFASIVAVDTEDYRRFYENKTIKRYLSIPLWLDARAKDANINLSSFLQRALKAELQITD